MSDPLERRVDSREIDSRQRRELTELRERQTSELFGEYEAAAAERRARLGELLALSPAQFKSFENRMRRMADRRGLNLIKSRRRDRQFSRSRQVHARRCRDKGCRHRGQLES